MKKIIEFTRMFFVLTISIILTLSCVEKNDNIIELDNLSFYSNLEQNLRKDLTNKLNYSETELFSKDIFLQAAFEKQYNQESFYMQFGSISGDNFRVSSSEVKLSSTCVLSLKEIGYLIDNSESLSECIIELNNKFNYIKNNHNIDGFDKDFLLTYIVTFKVALEHTFNSFPTNARVAGWWSSWGKCASGILGGGLTGAVTFGLGGAVVGTVALPIIGTVSAGTVGLVVGGIGGALTGAATFCGNSMEINNNSTACFTANNGETLCYDNRPISISPNVTTNNNVRSISVLL
jgi:hypothetical protein